MHQGVRHPSFIRWSITPYFYLFFRLETMAMNLFKNNFIVGVTAGLVAALIAPVLIPALKRSGRPIAKGLIKGGAALYEKGREATAYAGEMLEDVMAEIQSEQAEKPSESNAGSEWDETEQASMGSNGNGQLHPLPIEEDKNKTLQHSAAAA